MCNYNYIVLNDFRNVQQENQSNIVSYFNHQIKMDWIEYNIIILNMLFPYT